MNKIILLILFNFLIYYLCKTNIYLAISIFLFMIYYIIRLRYNITNNIIEGQSYETYEEIDYKNNFINSLNDDIIKNRESKFYLDIVFDKLNMFLKKYISKENIPVDQPCIGIFDSWSDCSVDCGTGSQYRKYSILQNSGEGGIKCIFKDGQIDKKTCYKGLCNYNASCVEDNDCNTGYCNPYTKLCDDREKCTIYALYNCEPDECDKLGENYHIDSNGNCIDYSQREYNPEYPGEKIGTSTTPNIMPFKPIIPDEKLGTNTTPNNIMPVMPIDNMPIEKLGTITTPSPPPPGSRIECPGNKCPETCSATTTAKECDPRTCKGQTKCWDHDRGVCGGVGPDGTCPPQFKTCPTKPVPEEIPDRGTPPNRLLKFINNTDKNIVIIGMVGDVGYYTSSNTNSTWSWLKEIKQKNIIGDKAGLTSQNGTKYDGWNAFVITSLKVGEKINILFPLMDASLSSNLTKGGNKFGISGCFFGILENKQIENGNIALLSNEITRFEISFVTDNKYKVADSFNISAIPPGCGAHMNCKATNFNSKAGIDWGDSCIENDYSYNINTNAYYYGNITSNTVVKNESKPHSGYSAYENESGSLVGPFTCGFPQKFSPKVIKYCNGLKYSVGSKDPGGDWEHKSNALDIKRCAISSAYQCLLNQSYLNNPTSNPIGLNFLLTVSSGETPIKYIKLPANSKLGYINQKKWDVGRFIYPDEGEKEQWKGAYGYPYQEELETDILSTDISYTKETTAYSILDLVKNNILNNKVVESPRTKLTSVSVPKNTVGYELSYSV